MPKLPKVHDCRTLTQFIERIAELCDGGAVTGIAVVLSMQNGEAFTSHQFGMAGQELAVAGALLEEYAKGSTVDHTAH